MNLTLFHNSWLKQLPRQIISLTLAILLLVTLSPTAVSAQTGCSEKDLQAKQVAILSCNPTPACTTSAGVVGGSLDRFLQVLAFQESGGNPTLGAKTSSASGKYQYINSTWAARASLYGPSGQYARAAQAPEEVQDAVAFIEYTQQLGSLGGDFFKMAVNHYLPAALKNASAMDTVPRGGNKLTPREYGNMLVQNMAKGVGSNIQLKYNQAPEFAVWLAKVGGSPSAGSASTTTTASGCSSSIGGTVVEIAQQELAAGANQANGRYLTYTGNQAVSWCAYFVSWVFDKAGKPFDGGPIGSVNGMLAYAKKNGYFHAKGEAGFTPQPGDVAIYAEGIGSYPSHVNIVIAYDAANATYTTIGGNESDQIKQSSHSTSLPALTGFMRVP